MIPDVVRLMRHIANSILCAVTILILQSGAFSAFADEIIWYSGTAAAAAMAKGTNRFMLVEISAPWCPSCKALERLMATKDISDWTNQRFVCVRVSADTPDGLALMRNYGMDGIPSLLVFDSNGRFKDKMQGGPEDPEGYVYYLTKMAGGESAFANVGNQGYGSGTAGGASAPPPQESQRYLSPAPQDYQSPQQGLQMSQQGLQMPQQGFQTPQPGLLIPQQGFRTAQPAYQSQQRSYQYQQQDYQPQQRYYQYPAQGYRRQKQYNKLLQQGQYASTPTQFQQPGQLDAQP